MTKTKLCILTNEQFNYSLNVDDITILFQSLSSVEYFIKHYSQLGYDIVINGFNERIKKSLSECIGS